jgi:hypothetical protein
MVDRPDAEMVNPIGRVVTIALCLPRVWAACRKYRIASGKTGFSSMTGSPEILQSFAGRLRSVSLNPCYLSAYDWASIAQSLHRFIDGIVPMINIACRVRLHSERYG